MPYLVKGTESLILNDPPNGIEAYSKTIEARPDDWLPYNQRGYLYLIAGQCKLAREDIEKSIELGPDVEWPYMLATLIDMSRDD